MTICSKLACFEGSYDMILDKLLVVYGPEGGPTLVVSPVRINYLRKNTLNRCSPRTTASGPRLNGGRNLALTLYLFFIST